MKTARASAGELTFLAVLGCAAIVAVFPLWGVIVQTPHRAALVAALGGLMCVLVSIHVSDRWLSTFSTYSGFFYLFHCGLLLLLAFDLPFTPLNPLDREWIESSATANAAIMYLVGHLAFTVAGCVTLLVRGSSQESQSLNGQDLDIAGAVGMVLFLLGLGIWSYLTVTSGAAVIGGSYVAFLEATGGAIMPYAYFAMSFGFALTGFAVSRAIRHLSLVMFAAWALPAFALGLRGEVIIPALLYGVVRARMGRLPFKPWYVLVLIGALAAGSIVRETRVDGVGSSGGLDSASANPLSGLAELGYTIRPLSLVFTWHTEHGEPFVGPGTYLNPFARLISGRTYDGKLIPLADDPTVFNYVVLAREGPIGGSPIAEAFRSGGMSGVLLVMMVIGFLCVLFDRPFRSIPALTAATMATYVLLVWVRNNVNPVAVSLLLTGAVTLLIWSILAVTRSSSRATSPGGRPGRRGWRSRS